MTVCGLAWPYEFCCLMLPYMAFRGRMVLMLFTAMCSLIQLNMALFDLVLSCMVLYGPISHFMVFYGRISSFLAVILDPNSFGLVHTIRKEGSG